MKRVVTFGEIMLRLSPEGYKRFVQADSFDAVYGGGEANVAVSLQNYGIPSRYITKLPDNELGYAAANALRRYGVDTGSILFGSGRLGIYFLEKGASQRASKVIYDRANSAFASLEPDEFHWDDIFEDAAWFHFTGITPAVSRNAALLCETACKAAKKKGLTISCDLNYRKNMWSREQANATMSALAEYVDICIGNEEDADCVFGIRGEHSDVAHGKLDYQSYEDIARQLTARFGFSQVAISLRESISASENNWTGMLYSKGHCYLSRTYPIKIVDRVGGGDSFSGGLIYALINSYEPDRAIEFAVAASCLKHSIEGDFNMVSAAEVTRLMEGDGSGRILR